MDILNGHSQIPVNQWQQQQSRFTEKENFTQGILTPMMPPKADVKTKGPLTPTAEKLLREQDNHLIAAVGERKPQGSSHTALEYLSVKKKSLYLECSLEKANLSFTM